MDRARGQVRPKCAPERSRTTHQLRPNQDGIIPLMLGLQQKAGNQAVSQMFRAAVRAPVLWIQRSEAGEHAQFGAKPGEKEEVFDVNGVKVPYGTMIAFGDFYENFEDVTLAPKEELQKLVDLIERDRKHYQGVRGVRAVTNEEWQNATIGRAAGRPPFGTRPPLFLDLAAKNAAHFAIANEREWKKYHYQAIYTSQAGQLELALQTNAFGDHFLTDAFSAGHLIKKERVVEEARTKLAKFGPHRFALRVADALLQHSAARETLSKYEISPSPFSTEWKPVARWSLSEVMEYIRKHKDSDYYSLFVRAVHDRLNRMALGKERGVLVQNFKSRWHLSGDETLNPKTREIAQAAVAESQQTIKESHKNYKVDVEELVDRVWAYVPRPVEEGEAAVKEAEQILTDASNPETAPALAEIAVSNLPSMINELTKYHMLREREKKPPDWEPWPTLPGVNPHGGQIVPPIFDRGPSG